LPKDWRIEEEHTDNDEYADYCPDYLNSLLMFFIEKHTMSIAYYEKFSRKK
jgi:hypothetical protein